MYDYFLVAQQLSSTLQKEIEFEKNEASAPPTWLADFKKQGVWKIEDKVGEKEVIFSRVFNNEKYITD
jgi:complement component 1 Q subcomponent-binding protein, mitochondrial